MRATILPGLLIILTKAHRTVVSMVTKGGLSTAFEVFLIFTTQLYSCYAVIVNYLSHIDKRGVL